MSGHSLKIWAPLRKLFAPPGVPSLLRAWSDSCSHSGYHHRSNQNLLMFLLKK